MHVVDMSGAPLKIPTISIQSTNSFFLLRLSLVRITPKAHRAVLIIGLVVVVYIVTSLSSLNVSLLRVSYVFAVAAG